MEILIGQEIYAMVGFGVDYEQFRMGQRDLDSDREDDIQEERSWLAGEAGENPGEGEEDDEDEDEDDEDEDEDDEDDDDDDEDDDEDTK